jgi:hypothetical protein
MDRIVVDERLPERLAIRLTPVEVVDTSGQVIGTFTPAVRPPEGYELGGPEPTLEELERIANTTSRWYTTDEVIAHLRRMK